ncbi:hypothetical protein SDC9_57022 [bioreactor metagenome]|uniref:SLH domain-containing protein n=1 Tax=bioreactor metagenome TaxID=1076179 RepID=A0A644X4G1_9ZZZZ
MREPLKKSLAFLLAGCMLLCTLPPAVAAQTAQPVQNAVAETGAYLLKMVPEPTFGTVGGEWAVIALARSGYETPQSWFDAYYNNLVSYVRRNGGVLSERKYTEYSRVILALTAIGKDPRDVAGYDLTEKLGDYDSVIRQGVNGAFFALLALDSGGYAVPSCQNAAVQTTRESLLNKILSQQLPDGGFSLDGKTADPDITAMALQALAPYQKQDGVKTAVEKAINALSTMQKDDGGYVSFETTSLESAVQVVVALTALGIDPGADSRFINSGGSVLDNLMTYYVPGGGFKHALDDDGPDPMATEQGLYGLAAYLRFSSGQNSLYDMSDAAALTSGQKIGGVGLAGKNPDVMPPTVLHPGKTFDDITGIPAKSAIEALASRGILSGTGGALFEPDRTMTRAEFAALAVRALGFVPVSNAVFSDVPEDSWYAPYVGTSNSYGIVTGTSETTFSPLDIITREQAAVMTERAAKLCGMDTGLTDTEIRDLLAQFPDYLTCSSWAGESLAFCYQNDILSQSALSIGPQEAVTRAEVAGMICAMLLKAELLSSE